MYRSVDHNKGIGSGNTNDPYYYGVTDGSAQYRDIFRFFAKGATIFQITPKRY